MSVRFPLCPHGNHVVIARYEAPTYSTGGLFIPEISRDRPHRGIVLAVGPGLHRDDGVLERPCVKVEDEVVYMKDHGTEVRIDGVELTLLRAEHILAVVGSEVAA